MSAITPHRHDTSTHVHAGIDHLATDITTAARLLVRIDRALMDALGVQANDVVRIGTERGRSLLARVDEPDAADTGRAIVRLDRFARQALKAHLNDDVEIERAPLAPVSRVELVPAIDVSRAHELVPHLKRLLAEARTPLSRGAVLYLPFPDSPAGTTYEVYALPDGAGEANADTEVVLHFDDAHVPDGAFDVTFEDVGGLGSQIRLIRELVQLPLKLPHVYRQLGINPPRGVILYGPPGAGKTHLARAVANEVEARFYYINGPDVIGTYAGETEGNLRRIFNEAGHHAPSIIFIDELDAIAPKRGETGAHADIRVVTQLLALMDGLKRVDSVIVVATTNRLDAVDPAFRRAGRFDREIFVGPPDAPGRREILDVQTREMPLTDAAQAFLDDVARRTHGFVGADIMELCRDAGLAALRRVAPNLADPRSAFQLPTGDVRVDRDDFEAALAQVRPSALRETLISIPDVGWHDVGGLATAKERLRELVEYPLSHPGIMAAAGLTAHAGVLLYGPPGTGKTLLAKAIATECRVNFISVDGPELFTKWLGESEEAVRHIFRIARQVAPTVVFIDQIDAIAPVRGDHNGSMTTERVVNQLLSELDGVQQLSHVIVVAATNRIDLVDPSFLRPGRFGAHLFGGLPDRDARAEIARIHLRKAAFDDAAVLEAIATALAAESEGFSGAQLQHVCDEAKRIAIRDVAYARPSAPTLDQIREALAREHAGGSITHV
jgi:transitional endoplasmic reticulum ATPase